MSVAKGWNENALKRLLLGTVITAPACATTPESVPSPAQTPTCDMSESDRAWIEHALEAWRFASREITGRDAPTTRQACAGSRETPRSPLAGDLRGE